MSTANDIVRRALRAVGILTAGKQPTGADAADAMEHLQSLVLDLPGLIKGGRFRDVAVAGAYIAHEGDRCTASGAGVVTLPVLLARSGCTRPPMDLARVQILGAVANAGLWLYSATKGAWGRADALTLGSEMPFGAEDDAMLAAMLAVNLASEYGEEAELGQRTVALAAEGARSFRARFKRSEPVDWSRPEPDCDRAGWLPATPPTITTPTTTPTTTTPASGIVTSPTAMTVASGVTAGTLIATLTAPSLTTPTFSLVNPSGRYAISGNQLLAGLVEIDYSNTPADTVAIKALDADGVTEIVQVKPVTVTPGGGMATTDLNFVTGSYVNGSVADLVNTQANSLTVLDSAGVAQVFAANAVRRNDLGVDAIGDAARYVVANAIRPASWAVDALGFSNSVIVADTMTAGSTTWPNSRIFRTDNSGYCKTTTTEALTIGEMVVVQFAVRAITGHVGDGAWVKLYWNSAASEEGWYCGDLTATSPVWINDQTFGSSGVKTALLGATPPDAQGFTTVTLTYIAQATDLEIRMAPKVITTGSEISVGGVQVVRGTSSAKPWKDVVSATIVEAADLYAVASSSLIYTILQGGAGWFGLEVQGLGLGNLGLAGWSGSTAGDLLLCGATHTLKPSGATEFLASGSGNPQPLGLGGWRGIVRIAMSWNDATGWSVCANGGPVLTGGAGGLTHAGAIGLLRGVTGKIRRLSASATRPTDTALRNWTTLYNKTFVRPGKALVPGAATVTFFDDFDANSLQTIPTPAFPYGSGGAMLDAYWDATDTAHAKKWKPRAHFYTASADGNYGASEQINHELQGYNDPQNGAGIVTHEFGVTVSGRASYFRGTTALTSSLTSGQKAHVGNNPSYGATGSLSGDQKYDYVSWMMTTAGSDTSVSGWNKGGFAQKYGTFEIKAQAPTNAKGAWWAFWLYSGDDSSELDIQEQLGPNSPFGGPTMEEFSTHWDNFSGGGTTSIDTAEILAADQHSYASTWTAGTVSMYLDGELVSTKATGGSFDNRPKFLLMNMAVQPFNGAPYNAGAPAPDSASRATMPWLTLVDRVQVLQFGA